MKYDYDAKKDYIDHNGNWNNDGLIDWGPLKTDNTSDNKPKNKENTLNKYGKYGPMGLGHGLGHGTGHGPGHGPWEVIWGKVKQ